MARRLYGFLANLMAETGFLVSAEGQEVTLGNVSGGDEVILFVPATEVTILEASVPIRAEKAARQAAAFAVEDDIAVSVEDSHFALGPAGSDLKTPRAVHVTSLDVMQTWTDWLSGLASLAKAKLVAAPSLLSAGDVFEVEGECLANIDGRVFGLEMQMPEDLRGALLGDHRPVSLSRAGFLMKLAEAVQGGAQVIDLRQGVFEAREGFDLSGIRPWRLSGILVGALCLLWGTGNYLDVRALKQETSRVRADIRSAYEASFPGAAAPRDYVRAFTRAASEQGGPSGVEFRAYSAALYTALRAIPTAELRTLSYDSANGRLIARVAYVDYGDDALLKAALGEAGIPVSLGAVRQDAGRVLGDVTLGEAS